MKDFFHGRKGKNRQKGDSHPGPEIASLCLRKGKVKSQWESRWGCGRGVVALFYATYLPASWLELSAYMGVGGGGGELGRIFTPCYPTPDFLAEILAVLIPPLNHLATQQNVRGQPTVLPWFLRKTCCQVAGEHHGDVYFLLAQDLTSHASCAPMFQKAVRFSINEPCWYKFCQL